MKGIILALIFYLIAIFGISFYLSKKFKGEDFLIANRDRGFISILFSKFAGSVGVGWFITYTAYSYVFGIGVFSILLGYIFGYIGFAYVGYKFLFEDSRKHKFYTINDIVFFKTKSILARNVSSWFSNSITFLWLLITLVGSAKIFSYFGIFSYEIALVVLLVVVGIYLFIAGFKGVVITDIIQSIIILVLLFILSFVILHGTSVSVLLSLDNQNLTFASIIGFFLYGSLSFFAYSDRYQLLFSSKSKKDFIYGMSLAIVPLLIAASFLLLIGLFVFMQDSTLDSGIVFLRALEIYLPENLISLGVVLFLAGAMSSIDTGVFSIATHSFFKIKNSNKQINKIRFRMILILTIALILSYFFRDIIGLTVFAAGYSMTFVVPMLCVIFAKKSRNKFFGSLIGSLIGLILGIYFIGLKPSSILPVLILSLIGIFISSRFK